MKLLWKLDLIGVSVALALPAATYWTQVSPAISRNVAGAATLQQLERSRVTQADLQKSLATITKSSPATTQSSLTLAPLSHLNHLLADLNEITAKHGLTLDSLEPADAAAHERYAVTSINLAAQGRYSDCQAWMRDLQQLPDVSITQWQLDSTGTDKNQSMHLTATLRWFALPKAGSR